jgi:hypothetical protein
MYARWQDKGCCVGPEPRHASDSRLTVFSTFRQVTAVAGHPRDVLSFAVQMLNTILAQHSH